MVATEFCGTSISSLAIAHSRIDAARAFNPHVHDGRGDQRGYMRFELDAKKLQVQVRVVDALDPRSGVTTAARFTVDAKKAGAVKG